jgi:hypothetical protein
MRVTRLDHEVAPLNPTEPFQRVTERAKSKGLGLGGEPSDLDRGRLRPGTEGRRKQAGRTSQERAAVHHSIT